MTTQAPLPTSVRLGADLHRRVEEFAQGDRRSVSNAIRVLIERGLDDRRGHRQEDARGR